MKANQFIQKFQRVLNTLIDKINAPIYRLVILLAIKYLYITLTVLLLKDLWYVGYGSYGIDFVFWKEILGSIVFVAVAFYSLRVKPANRFINNLLCTLFVLYYIPLNSAFSINNQSFLFFLLSNIYYFLLIAFVHTGVRIYKKLRKKNRSRRPEIKSPLMYHDKSILLFCAVICILFIIYKLAYNGFSLSLSMAGEDVYGNRAEFQSNMDEISGTLFSYLLAILRNVVSYVSPYYIMVSLLQKKWPHAVLGVLCTLAQYSVFSGKATLMFLAIIAGLYLLKRLNVLKRFDCILECGILLVLLVCVLEQIILRSDRVFTLLIRRIMYYPAWLSTMYYEYFMENGPVLWTQNVFLLQNIFEPVYDTSPLLIISNTYFGGQVPSPNNGLLAEAVMHFGALGTLIYPILLSMVFVVSAAILEPYGRTVQILMVIKLAMQLQNVPITRTDFILSYFLFIGVLWILPKLKLPQQYEKLRLRFSDQKNTPRK